MDTTSLKQELDELFPTLAELDTVHKSTLMDSVKILEIAEGAITYQPGSQCESFLMCLAGGTRVFKSSECGREILLYRVQPGDTCVLTTSCLLAQRPFPAASVAEADTFIAALGMATFQELMAQSQAFRRFVFDHYAEVLADLIVLVDEVAFSSIDHRLARHLVKSARANGIAQTTHQQLAQDLGTVREVVSRHLEEWERIGIVAVRRGRIEILDSFRLRQFADI